MFLVPTERTLSSDAGVAISRKLKSWEEECCSKALDRDASADLFRRMFITDLSELDAAFHEYLKGLL